MARGGKLNVNIDSVRLVNGDKVARRAVKEGSGGGHTGAMVGGMVATGIVFFPAAAFFLFMHGKDITIPKGTEITAYVSGDMKLDVAKFQSAAASSAPQTGSSVSPVVNSSAKIQLDTNPQGADIEIDGSFVGNTPSELQVAEGEHTITVKRTGFTNWEKKMKVSGGSSVHLNAELEKNPAQ